MLRRDGEDILLECLLQPRASRDEIVGEHDGALKIRVKAPPVDGAANRQLVKFLAKQFGVSKSGVIIERGETSRRKQVRITNPEKIPEGLGPP